MNWDYLKCIHKCIRILFKRYSYSNTFETDVFVFIFMEMKSIRIHIRILLKGFIPSLVVVLEKFEKFCCNFNFY